MTKLMGGQPLSIDFGSHDVAIRKAIMLERGGTNGGAPCVDGSLLTTVYAYSAGGSVVAEEQGHDFQEMTRILKDVSKYPMSGNKPFVGEDGDSKWDINVDALPALQAWSDYTDITDGMEEGLCVSVARNNMDAIYEHILNVAEDHLEKAQSGQIHLDPAAQAAWSRVKSAAEIVGDQPMVVKARDIAIRLGQQTLESASSVNTRSKPEAYIQFGL